RARRRVRQRGGRRLRPLVPEERIQKVLAAAGVASRRAAEALVAEGRVRVDGRRAEIGQKVDTAVSTIEVDGRAVGIGAARAYVALHKPAGVTSTTRDRHAATTVLDLIPTALVPDGARLYPVGRLDQDSEGMLLLTNDGAWADRVLHPRHGVEREYAIGLRAALDDDQATALQAGIPLDEGLATLGALRPMTAIETQRLADLLRPSPSPDLVWYRATLTQGWKRQLRRMFGAVGVPARDDHGKRAKAIGPPPPDARPADAAPGRGPRRPGLVRQEQRRSRGRAR